LSPTSRTFPNPLDPEQLSANEPVNLPGSERLSPFCNHKDVTREASLTSSKMISSADVTETDTDDPQDLETRDTEQRNGTVQVARSRKRKRRRKNTHKRLPDSGRVDPREESQGK